MGSVVKNPEAAADLYERDFCEWSTETAERMRQRAFDAIDWENVIEEIESLGKRERRDLFSRIEVLLLHLLKWHFQPEFRCGSWLSSINEQRHQIGMILEDSPSLRSKLPEGVKRNYPRAAEKAVEEMRLIKNPFPPECPFTIEQILNEHYLPE